MVDRLALAVILLDAGGGIRFMNRAAQQIVSSSDGVAVRNDRIELSTARATAALQLLVQNASRAFADAAAGTGGTMKCQRPSMRQPFEVQVGPIRSSQQGPGEPTACVAVMIADPTRVQTSNPELWRVLYGLTSAETRVVSVIGLRSMDSRTKRMLTGSRERLAGSE